MKMIIDFAAKDDRIRLATLEGSRTNKNISPDAFQDYDLSYFVTDMDSFKENDHWLDQFGKRIMMQKPEDMELLSPLLTQSSPFPHRSPIRLHVSPYVSPGQSRSVDIPYHPCPMPTMR